MDGDIFVALQTTQKMSPGEAFNMFQTHVMKKPLVSFVFHLLLYTF